MAVLVYHINKIKILEAFNFLSFVWEKQQKLITSDIFLVLQYVNVIWGLWLELDIILFCPKDEYKRHSNSRYDMACLGVPMINENMPHQRIQCQNQIALLCENLSLSPFIIMCLPAVHNQ